MLVGLAYDLKDTLAVTPGCPEDIAEEYDSVETVNLITASLSSLGHTVLHLGGGTGFLHNICSITDIDIVFNISEGRGNHPGREAQVPSVLEMCNIPYTGSPPQCLSICLNKPLTKQILAASGIITPKWIIIKNEKDLDSIQWEGLRFPLVAKPAHEGSSIGIHSKSVAYDVNEVKMICESLINSYNQEVMLEEYIHGEEVTVGIVGFETPQVLGIMGIKPKANHDMFMYSIEVKRDYVNLVDYECPSLLPEDVLDNIKNISLKTFNILGCRDMARLDFRVDINGTPYFIEINPLPGLGNHSDLVIMSDLLGIKHRKLIDMILSSACQRYPKCILK
ncbi:MAG: D-alanine--D-alanine ligase [Dehalococcoidales bacterium]